MESWSSCQLFSLGMARLAAYSTRLDAALQTGVVKSRAGEALSILSPTRWERGSTDVEWGEGCNKLIHCLQLLETRGCPGS